MDVEYSDRSAQRSSPFPVSWGEPPRDEDRIAAWAARHIRHARLRRRTTPGVIALAELYERFGVKPDEAMAELRRRRLDPSLVRPTLSVEDALRALDRRAVRFATMCRLVAES